MHSNIKKYPALFTVMPLAAGILISYLFNKHLISLNHTYFIIVLYAFVLTGLFSYCLRKKYKSAVLVFFASVTCFGFFSFQYRYYRGIEDNIQKAVSNFSQDKIVLSGTAAENPVIKPESIRILLEDVAVNGKRYEGLILASVYRNKFKETGLKDLSYGSTVEIEGNLEPPPHRKNPGEFDYGQYLKMHDIDAVFYTYGFDKIKITGRNEQNFYKSKIINPVREYSLNVINSFYGGDEGEYLKGLILGERSNISNEMKKDFINAGVAHIIAVSGLNVAYVLIIIWALLTFIPVKQNYKILLAILLLFFYMNLTGNTPSIVRAAIMACVFLTARGFERRTSIYNVISFSALVILLIDPRQLFDAGFILSFSAILSIVILYPKFEEWLNKLKWYSGLSTDKFTGKTVKLIPGLLFGTLAAQVGILPVTAIMFRKISIVSLIANLFAIPLSNITLAIGFITVIASLISSWLASVFSSVNVLLMYLQLKAIAFCANMDYAFVETYFVNGAFLFVYYLILILLYRKKSGNYIKRLVIVILLILNFYVYMNIAESTDKARVTYSNTGISNSTLIKMPGGTNIMINPGGSKDKNYSAQRSIIPYLKTERIDCIDILVINSLNINEYKNLVYLINNFSIKKLILPVYYKPIFLNNSDIKNLRIDYIYSSTIINKQGNFRIYVYYNPYLKGESMMSEFVYGQQSFIFSDSRNITDDLINSAYMPEENALMVLKASGSGSFNFNSAEFIAKADPEFIVISSSDRGRKKADSEIFNKSLNEAGYTVLNTSDEGAVIFETDGFETKRVLWR